MSLIAASAGNASNSTCIHGIWLNGYCVLCQEQKRLHEQEHLIKHAQNGIERCFELVENLGNFRVKQIDENGKIARRIDELEGIINHIRSQIPNPLGDNKPDKVDKVRDINIQRWGVVLNMDNINTESLKRLLYDIQQELINREKELHR